MYAPYLIRRWSQTFSGGLEKTQFNNEGSGKERSLVQVGPKKGGIIVIRTENNALLPS